MRAARDARHPDDQERDPPVRARARRKPVRTCARRRSELSQATPRLTTSPRRSTGSATWPPTTRTAPSRAAAPPGRDEGYLYWLAWLGHNGEQRLPGQDGNGFYRRIYFTASCEHVHSILARARWRPLVTGLGALFQDRLCPVDRGTPEMQKQAPSVGSILVAVGFTLSCFGLILFLWITFGGPIPLKPQSYRFTADFPEATQLAKRGRRADRRRLGRQGQGDRARAAGKRVNGKDTTEAVIEIEPSSRRSPPTRGRSCARRRCSARPTSS